MRRKKYLDPGKCATVGSACSPDVILSKNLFFDSQPRPVCRYRRGGFCCSAAAALPDDFAFVGTSEWTDEAQGRARVEVNFTDDLVALRAFREATQFLNDAVVR